MISGKISDGAKVDNSSSIPYSTIHPYSIIQNRSKISYSDVGDRSLIDNSIIDYCGSSNPIRASDVKHSTVQYSGLKGSKVSDTSIR